MNLRRILGFLLTIIMLVSSVTALAGETPKIAVYATGSKAIWDWDPASGYSIDYYVFLNTYEQLVRYPTDGNGFLPGLATEYSVSDDGLVWTFKLREGVKFHCGEAFTAEAVKFSLERNRDLGRGASFLWDDLKEVNIVDDYTVELILSNPVSILDSLACRYCSYIYCPHCVSHDLEESNAWFMEGNICGTGPYKLVNHTADTTVVLGKFDEYWGGWTDKQFDNVVIQQVNESSTRMQMLQSGEATIINNIICTDVDSILNNPNMKLTMLNAKVNIPVWFNVNKPGLDNELIRKALAYAFPYDDVIKYIYLEKYAAKATDMAAPAMLKGALKSQPYFYDLEKAKTLLAEAGYPDGGLEFTVSLYSIYDMQKKMLELWKSELDKIGVTLNIDSCAMDVMDAKAFSTDVNVQPDMVLHTQGADTLLALDVYRSILFENGSWGFSHCKEPELDKELLNAYYSYTTQPEASMEAMRAVEEKYMDKCYVISLCDVYTLIASQANLKGDWYNASHDDCCYWYYAYIED